MSDENENLNGENGALVPADTSELRERVARQAKLLSATAAELEQAAFFDEPEFAGELLLPKETLEKRYTGENGKKALALWESRRNHILDLLGCGWPVDEVARRTKSNSRLVKALGAAGAATAAQSSKVMANVLGKLAMKAAFHIDQKMDEAKAGELGVVMGISLQRKMELDVAGSMGSEPDAIELETETPERLAFKEHLKLLREGKLQRPENPQIAPINADEKEPVSAQ